MSWNTLKNIIAQNREEAKKEASEKMTVCPICFAPLYKNAKGALMCQFHGEVGHA